MNIEKAMVGSTLIFINTLIILVSTPKEGLEIMHYGVVMIGFSYGCYLNYKAIYG